MSISNNTSTQQGPIKADWIYRYPVQVHPFSFEKNVDLVWWYEMACNNWQWALYAGVFYVVTIFTLQRWMKNKPAMNLKMPLFWWNLGLAALSTLGFARTAPGVLQTLGEPNGFYTTICTRNWMDIPIEFWIVIFIMSKFLEFGDTVFIVLRKKPLVFIHWYHHLVSMLACWTMGPMVEPAGICYMVINFGVHLLIYPYFALRAIGYNIPKIFANVITALECLQMIVGLMINIISVYYRQIGQDCAISDWCIKVNSAMFGSFILLFGKLFLDSVLMSSSKLKEKKGKFENESVLLTSSRNESQEKKRS